VRIRSVTLQGFKSFGHRTRIECSPGVTAIVGPNGSGKSNLLDALKWVTGGGRAREFRAESRTDLIFHGAEGKRGVGFAEVEVELSDAAKRISIRRDLDRAGLSRLRLNGRAARFIDIDEALAGSGLGTAGVAMIGQGEVAGVLMADPETLLRYVAEAAGVARLAGRREQTEARLDAAGAHLLNLENLLVELRAHIEHLRHEADVAARHQALNRESLALRVTAGHARVAALEGEVGGMRQQVVAAEAALHAGRERLAAAQHRNEALAHARTERERRYREALAASERARGALALAEANHRRALERRDAAQSAATAAEGEAATLAASRAPVDPGIDLSRLRSAAEDARAEAEGRRAARRAAEAELAAARSELERLRATESALRAAWSAFDARRAALQEEEAQIEVERTAPALQHASEVDALEAHRDAAREAVAAQEAALERARALLERAHARHAEAHGGWIAAERHHRSSEQAFRTRQGYAQGPRTALASRIPGVIGSVAEILAVPEAYRAALAGALGRRAEYVVVENATVGAEVLAAVRAAGGWVTLLPLDLLRARPIGGTLPEGAITWATAVVEVDPAYAVVVEQLLGQTALMPDLQHATAVARAQADRPRLVTLAGEVIEASGAMSGGRRSGGATVLGLGRDLERAEAEFARCHRDLQAALQAREGAAEEVRALQAGLALARRTLDEAEGAHRAALTAVTQAQERRAAHAAREARLVEARAALRPPAEALDGGTIAAAVAAVAAAEVAWQGWQQGTEAARQAAAEAERDVEVGAERMLAFETAKLAQRQALERAAALRLVAAERAREVAQWTEEAARTAAAREAAVQALPRDLEGEREAFEAAEAAMHAAAAAQRTLIDGQAEAAEALEGLRLTLARREALLEVALDERAALPEGVTLLPLGERAARARLREVEGELEGLGPVNHRAAIDCASQGERLRELEGEGAQATSAVEELRTTLATIDAETNSRLNRALAGLQEGFAEHVRQLFGPSAIGGVEVERQGERPTGVRIRLQPPGKRTESLNLLSVGERTMGAMAFLFALMAGDAGSLPIAVLDEVDAPLDEANIRRFCAFIAALASRGTQFVLITHQKATFEVADTLWGVTSEAGVSRVFSMRRDDFLDDTNNLE
jgi:chromosome segregation protein